MLVPYAGVKGLNALPVVDLSLPVFQPGAVVQTIDGGLVAVPSGVAWETVGTVTFAVPAESATAVGGTGAVMAVNIDGTGGGGNSGQGENTTDSVSVDEVQDWMRTEELAWLDQDAIADIDAKLQANDSSIWNQPIEVAEIDCQIYVFNGHHRLAGAIKAGYGGKIPVTRITPPRDFVPGDHFGTFGN